MTTATASVTGPIRRLISNLAIKDLLLLLLARVMIARGLSPVGGFSPLGLPG
jgi:hypothetical protein